MGQDFLDIQYLLYYHAKFHLAMIDIKKARLERVKVVKPLSSLC